MLDGGSLQQASSTITNPELVNPRDETKKPDLLLDPNTDILKSAINVLNSLPNTKFYPEKNPQ